MKNFIIKYKLFITIIVPLLFFVFTTLIIIYPSSSTTTQPSPSPSVNSSNSPVPTLPNNKEVFENLESLENTETAQRKENLPDGTVKYYFQSKNEDRENIFITQGEKGPILFERYVITPNLPVKINAFASLYGQPKWVFRGSEFYGSEAQTYIYPELGIAFIANPKTQEVFEQHIFSPAKVEDYVKKYGDDIPAQP
jgi:hypothetical protein